MARVRILMVEGVFGPGLAKQLIEVTDTVTSFVREPVVMPPEPKMLKANFRSPPPHKRSSGSTGQFKLQRGKPNKYTPHQGAKQRGNK